ncbi:MAG: GH25 family lysozyme [Eggerthellaceae bacterium]
MRSSLTRSEARVIASSANLGRKALCLLLVAALIVGFMPLASAPEALAAASSSSATGKVDAAYAAEGTKGPQSEDDMNSWRYEDGELQETQKDTSTSDPDVVASSNGAAGSSTSGNGTSGSSASGGSSTYSLKARASSNPLIAPETAYDLYNAGGALALCIDVSYANGKVNWEKVKASGVEYAIIQCGYGSNYTSQDDIRFLENVQGAQAVGIKIGVYLYSYATTTSMANSEGRHALRCLQLAGLSPDDLALPVYFDMEDKSTENIGADQLGYNARAFCSTVGAAGYKTGIYASAYWWNSKLTSSVFRNSAWSRWVAHYPLEGTNASCAMSDKDIWQFASDAHVSGAEGATGGHSDLNFIYRTYEDLTSISGGSVTLSGTSFTYTGKNISPTVSSLKLANGKKVATTSTVKGLNAGSADETASQKLASYTITYKNRKDVGTATAYIWGNGAYTGCMKVTYTIKPTKVSGIKLTAKSKAFKVSWSSHKTQTTGFQIRYSTSSKMTSYKTVTLSSKSYTSKTISKLKGKKNYYVKVRAYKTVDGVKYYGSWSSVKKIKTLK